MRTIFFDLEDERVYYAARWAWKHRHIKVPEGDYTWEAWFERMFKEPLKEYAKRQVELANQEKDSA